MNKAHEVWKTLSAIDVSQHIEKKGNLSYLSWAWAWQTLMDNFPDSTYQYNEPLYLTNDTVEVDVSVTVGGNTHQMWLPVMDNRNKSIANPTSRDVSDARMRCLVKCIAVHGLGLYIYSGSDLPEAVKNAVIDGAQLSTLIDLLDSTGADIPAFCKHFKIERTDQLLASHFDRAVAALNAKAKK